MGRTVRRTNDSTTDNHSSADRDRRIRRANIRRATNNGVVGRDYGGAGRGVRGSRDTSSIWRTRDS